MSDFSIIIAIKCDYCEKQLCRTFEPAEYTTIKKTCYECGARWTLYIDPKLQMVYGRDPTGNLDPWHEPYEIVDDDDDTDCELG